MNYHDVMKMVQERAAQVLPKKKDEPRDPVNEAMRQAWQEMVSMPAWKDFQAILEEVNNMPLAVLDDKSVGEISLADAGFIKGVRSAIRTINQKVKGRL